MFGFAALNEESLSTGVVSNSREAEKEEEEVGEVKEKEEESEPEEEEVVDEHALQEEVHYLYNQALSLYGQGSPSRAAEAFRVVLESPFLRRKRFFSNPAVSRIRFGALKYLGYSLSEDGLGRWEECADRLKQAAVLDGSDANLLFRLGGAAVRCRPTRLRLARWALERTLVLSSKHFQVRLYVVQIWKERTLCV